MSRNTGMMPNYPAWQCFKGILESTFLGKSGVAACQDRHQLFPSCTKLNSCKVIPQIALWQWIEWFDQLQTRVNCEDVWLEISNLVSGAFTGIEKLFHLGKLSSGMTRQMAEPVPITNNEWDIWVQHNWSWLPYIMLQRPIFYLSAVFYCTCHMKLYFWVLQPPWLF